MAPISTFKAKSILVLGLAAISLTGCAETKKTLGFTKQVPDEFTVVQRAPLAMPPDYTLRPPQPGAARPQETSTSDVARSAVFGEEKPAAAKKASSAEASLLQQTGGSVASSEVRALVDEETSIIEPHEQPVADRLLNMGNTEPAASVVDAKAEAERLKENKKQGKSVTDGETPSKVE